MGFKASDYIAIIALAAPIIAIIVQLHAVRRQLFVQNFAEHSRRYNDVLRRMPAVVLDPDFRLSDLDDTMSEAAVRAAWEYFDLCFEQWYLTENRLVGRELAAIWRVSMRSAMRRPAFVQLWEVVRSLTSYPDAFVAFMNSPERTDGAVPRRRSQSRST